MMEYATYSLSFPRRRKSMTAGSGTWVAAFAGVTIGIMLTLVSVFSAMAQEAPRLGATEIIPAQAWKMNPQDSHLRFSVDAGGKPVQGAFRAFKTRILFDPANLRGSKIRVDVDITSINSADKDAASYLPTHEWFDSANYSNALFLSGDVRHLGGDQYEARGVLTIKGHSEPVTLPFALTMYEKDSSGAASHALIEGSLDIKRSVFGVGIGNWADSKLAADDVMVHYRIDALPFNP